jgi:hypothetical protein
VSTELDSELAADFLFTVVLTADSFLGSKFFCSSFLTGSGSDIGELSVSDSGLVGIGFRVSGVELSGGFTIDGAGSTGSIDFDGCGLAFVSSPISDFGSTDFVSVSIVPLAVFGNATFDN